MIQRMLRIIIDNKIFFLATSFILLLLVLVISQNPYIGRAEMAHYSYTASTILQGRGYMLDYIPNFYNIKFLEGNVISHPNDYFALGNSTFIAFFFLLFGESVFVAKMGNVFLLFVFSCLAYFFIKKHYDRNIALFTVLLTLTNIEIFNVASWPYADVGFLLFINISLVLMYCFTQTKKKSHLFFMAFFTALAVYFKQTGGLLVPTFFLVLAYYTLRKEMHFKSMVKYFFVFCLLFFMFISPIFIREYAHYGRLGFGLEVHSSMLKYQPWEEAYALYDSEDELPGIFPIKTYGLSHMVRIDLRHLLLTFQSFFIDQPVSVAILFLALLHLFFLRKEDIPLFLPYAIFSVFFSLFALGIWFFEIRYYIIFFPLLYLLGSLSLFRIIKPLFVKPKLWIIFLLITSGIILFPFVNEYYFLLKGNSNEEALVDGFLWIKENTPEDAVIMSRNMIDLTFHTGRKSIATPYADYNRTMALIERYNVTYLEVNFATPTEKALAEMNPDLIIRQQFRELYLGQNTADFELVYSNDLVYVFKRKI